VPLYTGMGMRSQTALIWQISDSFLVHKDNWRVDVLITEMEEV